MTLPLVTRRGFLKAFGAGVASAVALPLPLAINAAPENEEVEVTPFLQHPLLHFKQDGIFKVICAPQEFSMDMERDAMPSREPYDPPMVGLDNHTLQCTAYTDPILFRVLRVLFLELQHGDWLLSTDSYSVEFGALLQTLQFDSTVNDVDTTKLSLQMYGELKFHDEKKTRELTGDPL